MAESKKRLGVDDIDAGDVWERLAAEPSAVLIDVRTQAEWVNIGVPNLAAIGKQLLMVEWMSLPDKQLNPLFADQLESALESIEAGRDAELYFICRSGIRSLAAAQVMVNAGYRACYNVASGFEGPGEGDKQSGKPAGWVASGLPWVRG